MLYQQYIVITVAKIYVMIVIKKYIIKVSGFCIKDHESNKIKLNSQLKRKLLMSKLKATVKIIRIYKKLRKMEIKKIALNQNSLLGSNLPSLNP